MKFKEDDLIWIRAHPQSRVYDAQMAKLAPQWKGPAKILKLKGNVNYQAEILDNLAQKETVHIGKLKPYYGGIMPSSEGGSV